MSFAPPRGTSVPPFVRAGASALPVATFRSPGMRSSLSQASVSRRRSAVPSGGERGRLYILFFRCILELRKTCGRAGARNCVGLRSEDDADHQPVLWDSDPHVLCRGRRPPAAFPRPVRRVRRLLRHRPSDAASWRAAGQGGEAGSGVGRSPPGGTVGELATGRAARASLAGCAFGLKEYAHDRPPA